MNRYVTHQFAHPETLDRARRWLLQHGFLSSQLEVHREGNPWISVLASPDQSADAKMIIKAAELGDPDGWPSFWEMARTPHPHFEPVSEADASRSTVVTARPSPVGWHPADVNVAAEDTRGFAEVWDVNTRFTTIPFRR